LNPDWNSWLGKGVLTYLSVLFFFFPPLLHPFFPFSCTLLILSQNIRTIKRDKRSVATPVIVATWEAEIWRIRVPGQLRQIVHETSSPK
jgi:hypothetical protein